MVLWRVVVLGVCVRMSLCRLECRSARLCMLGDVSILVPRIWGHVLSPLIGGSAYANVMSPVFCPSTTPHAAVAVSSLCVTPVYEFFVGLVIEAEGIDGVFAHGVDAKGAICKYREGVFVLIGF